MTAYADMGAEAGSFPSTREMGLWVGAALVVLIAHAVLALAVHTLRPLDPQTEAAEQALVIDLTPLPVSMPESVASETLTEEVPEETLTPVEDVPDVVAEKPEPIETTTAEEVVEPELVSEPEQVVRETVEPETIEPTTLTSEPEAASDLVEPEVVEPERPAPKLTAPEVAEIVTPEVVLPIPEPRPVVEGNPNEQAEKKAEPRKEQAAKAVKQGPKKAKAEAKPAPKAEASKESRASKAPTVSPAKWQSRVLAWLNRHKRYPGGAKSRREQGTVRVAFAINASGAVISARITHSSGNSEIDKAALDMVQRASPVPAPPPEIARSRMNLSLPVQFSLK